MPKKGPNKKKLETIMKIIRSTKSNGIWIRELARQTNLPLATVHFYINKFLKDRVKIETVKIGELLINK
jgi:predicted transcriptional regulator